MITLLSDFGSDGFYVAQMKAGILRINPNVRIVDVSHSVAAQNILQGMVLLYDNARAFPEGTVHLAVVDPGVGTSRKPLAARLRLVSSISGNEETHFFVGPDNGIGSLLFDAASKIEAVYPTNREFWLPKISRTFHGRDIFGPVAAHLSLGVPLAELGEPVPTDPATHRPLLQRLEIPTPQVLPDRIVFRILYLDPFGNAITNLAGDADTESLLRRRERLSLRKNADSSPWSVECRLVGTYGEANPGEIVLLPGSSDRLEIAVPNGNAAKSLDLHPDTELMIR